MNKTEEIQPKVWNVQEAFSSGRTAYRIAIMRINNPFKEKVLWAAWDDGWKHEAANTKYSLERQEYVEERTPSNDRSRSSRSARPQRSSKKY